MVQHQYLQSPTAGCVRVLGRETHQCVCVVLPADGNWDAAGLHQFSSVGELRTKWDRGHLKCCKKGLLLGLGGFCMRKRHTDGEIERDRQRLRQGDLCWWMLRGGMDCKVGSVFSIIGEFGVISSIQHAGLWLREKWGSESDDRYHPAVPRQRWSTHPQRLPPPTPSAHYWRRKTQSLIFHTHVEALWKCRKVRWGHKRTSIIHSNLTLLMSSSLSFIYWHGIRSCSSDRGLIRCRVNLEVHVTLVRCSC